MFQWKFLARSEIGAIGSSLERISNQLMISQWFLTIWKPPRFAKENGFWPTSQWLSPWPQDAQPRAGLKVFGTEQFINPHPAVPDPRISTCPGRDRNRDRDPRDRGEDRARRNGRDVGDGRARRSRERPARERDPRDRGNRGQWHSETMRHR